MADMNEAMEEEQTRTKDTVEGEPRQDDSNGVVVEENQAEDSEMARSTDLISEDEDDAVLGEPEVETEERVVEEDEETTLQNPDSEENADADPDGGGSGRNFGEEGESSEFEERYGEIREQSLEIEPPPMRSLRARTEESVASHVEPSSDPSPSKDDDDTASASEAGPSIERDSSPAQPVPSKAPAVSYSPVKLPPRTHRPPVPFKAAAPKNASSKAAGRMLKKSVAEKCCVSSCRNYYKIFPVGQGLVHGFPETTSLRNTWIRMINNSAAGNKAVELLQLNRTPTLGVCREHFRKMDYIPAAKASGIPVLKPVAYPSIFVRGVNTAPQLVAVKPSAARGPKAGRLAGTSMRTAGQTSIVTPKVCNIVGCSAANHSHPFRTGGILSRITAIPATQPPIKKTVTVKGPQEEEEDMLAATGLTRTRSSEQAEEQEDYYDDTNTEAEPSEEYAETEGAYYFADDPFTEYSEEIPVSDESDQPRAPLKLVLAKAQPPAPKEAASSSRAEAPPLPMMIPATMLQQMQAAAAQRGNVQEPDEMDDSPFPRPPIKIVLQKMVPEKTLMITRPVQVSKGDLDDDSDDEETADMMRESHLEMVELQLALESAESQLQTERFKVAHLEARVTAWIREHFTQQQHEIERMDTLDKLASYYLARARKVEDEKKAVSSEVELFRANYVRAQKETDSYRQQIIELQSTSARQVELVVQTKTRTEKEAMETIGQLRRQLAESSQANQAARKKMEQMLSSLGVEVPEEISSLDTATPIAAIKGRQQPKRQTASAAKKAQAAASAKAALQPATPQPVSSVIPQLVQQPQGGALQQAGNATPTTPAFNPRNTRQRNREAQQSAQVVTTPVQPIPTHNGQQYYTPTQPQPHMTIQQQQYYHQMPPQACSLPLPPMQSVIQPTPSVSAFSQPVYQQQQTASYATPPSTRKRTRAATKQEEQATQNSGTPSPKKPRESSVDRAVRYLMSL